MQLDGNRYNNYILCPPTPMTTSTVQLYVLDQFGHLSIGKKLKKYISICCRWWPVYLSDQIFSCHSIYGYVYYAVMHVIYYYA